MPAHSASDAAERSQRLPGRAIALMHWLALAGGGALILLTVGSDRWTLGPLVTIAALTVVSDLTSVQGTSAKIKLSGSFLGIMLAAILLGTGPAAIIAIFSILVGWLRFREAGHYLRNNLASFMWFPLIGSAFFHAAVRLADVGPHQAAYYMLVFAAFVIAMGTELRDDRRLPVLPRRLVADS